jgi:hypothetical protein
MLSDLRPPSVHDQIGAPDIATLVGVEETRRRGELFRTTETAESDDRRELKEWAKTHQNQMGDCPRFL